MKKKKNSGQRSTSKPKRDNKTVPKKFNKKNPSPKRKRSKKFLKKLAEEKTQVVLCTFFRMGKCTVDDCTYSHDVKPDDMIRFKEPCRYYPNDDCNKGNMCCYMHEDWPCMYYHNESGNLCKNTASICRYSHEPLEPELKIAFKNWLDKQSKRGKPDMETEEAKIVCLQPNFGVSVIPFTDATTTSIETKLPTDNVDSDMNPIFGAISGLLRKEPLEEVEEEKESNVTDEDNRMDVMSNVFCNILQPTTVIEKNCTSDNFGNCTNLLMNTNEWTEMDTNFNSVFSKVPEYIPDLTEDDDDDDDEDVMDVKQLGTTDVTVSKVADDNNNKSAEYAPDLTDMEENDNECIKTLKQSVNYKAATVSVVKNEQNVMMVDCNKIEFSNCTDNDDDDCGSDNDGFPFDSLNVEEESEEKADDKDDKCTVIKVESSVACDNDDISHKKSTEYTPDLTDKEENDNECKKILKQSVNYKVAAVSADKNEPNVMMVDCNKIEFSNCTDNDDDDCGSDNDGFPFDSLNVEEESEEKADDKDDRCKVEKIENTFACDKQIDNEFPFDSINLDDDWCETENENGKDEKVEPILYQFPCEEYEIKNAIDMVKSEQTADDVQEEYYKTPPILEINPFVGYLNMEIECFHLPHKLDDPRIYNHPSSLKKPLTNWLDF